MLARKAMSKASPTSGTAPTTVSSSVLPTMRHSVNFENAELARLPDEIRGHHLRRDVAHHRHEAEQGIDAEADARAGDGEQRIHQLGDGGDARHGGFDLGALEPLDALVGAGGVGFGVGH